MYIDLADKETHIRVGDVTGAFPCASASNSAELDIRLPRVQAAPGSTVQIGIEIRNNSYAIMNPKQS